MGINFGKGSNSSCGLNVYTDPNCGHFARKTLTGKDNQFKCFSMEANGGAWQSLAAAVCDDEQPQMEQFTVER